MSDEGVLSMAAHAELHMRDTDAFTWYMEQDPLLRSTVVALTLFDHAPDWDRLVDKIDRASRVIPGLRQKVVVPPLRLSTPRWVVDADFDLSWHLRRVEAPPPRTLETVLELARTAGMADFDRARPLWELTFVEGLEDGRTAGILKIHHSLTDGIGGMQLAMELFELDPNPHEQGPVPDAPTGERLSTIDVIREALAFDRSRAVGIVSGAVGSAFTGGVQAIRHPAHAAARAVGLVRSVAKTVMPVRDTLSPVMTERRLAWRYDTFDVPLDSLKRAAKAVDGTLNDAFLASVAGGLRRYHERHGAPVEELRVTLPISIRKEGDPAGGNRITLMRFKVPVGEADPVARIHALHELMLAERAEPSVPLTNAIAASLNLLPTGFIGGMLKHVDFLASNVPGLPLPVYLGGARLERFYAFGPTIGASVNITLMSYCDACHLGVTTDTGAVPDHDVMLECLREGFDEVLELAD